MSLQYIQKVEDFITKSNKKSFPVLPDEINDLEKKNKITLPKSYKEFLFFTGKYFAPLDINGLSAEFLILEKANENARSNLKEYGLEKLITKDFWVIAEMDGSVFIHYIFLDEGDNPPVYTLDMEGYTEFPDMRDEFYGKMTNSFSDYVEAYIESYDPKYD
ncbi:hypothetical protein BA768_04745 [Chryseobacterium sp. CBo1]|uniref:SMI1/KNR4 family protein n=1 Tax=Chryseobacterium sp. CBo1 TaxID=1869230 RepID=UPI00081065E7|nr:SMI1/KNR4 family protein [Chryseobacterium sp. CBo1]OCK50466.1 hypothetical protein BA768_04745 [Chryseobacterium sp. CBo1]